MGAKKGETIVERLNQQGNEAKRLATWRANLVREIGGEESLTWAKREMVEQACRIKLALDRADLGPTQKAMDTGSNRSTTLRRALLYALKMLGLGADRRIAPVRPRSRVAEIGARLVAERLKAEAEGKPVTAGRATG